MAVFIKGKVLGDVISDGGVKNETHYHYGNSRFSDRDIDPPQELFQNYYEQQRERFADEIDSANQKIKDIMHESIVEKRKINRLKEMHEPENTDSDRINTTPTSPKDTTLKSSSFTPAVIDASKAAEVIILLRQLMEGKTKPKDVLMPVRAAMDAGVIRRPTWEEFCQEFGLWRVKNKSSFSDYTNPDNQPYIGVDFELIKDKFRQLMSEGQ